MALAGVGEHDIRISDLDGAKHALGGADHPLKMVGRIRMIVVGSTFQRSAA